MTTVIHIKKDNIIVRTFTVLSVEVGDVPETAIMMTEEDGAVAVSKQDRSELYDQLVTAGLL